MRVRALDGFEGQLASALLQLDVAPLKAPRPWPLSWKAWGIGAAVFGAAGLASGIVARVDTGRAQGAMFGDTAYAYASRAQVAVVAADTGFAIAGALLLGALLLLLTEPPRE